MTDVPFHATRMGQRFYEHTMPELERQLARLNENLERLVDERAGGGGASSPPRRDADATERSRPR